MVTVERARDVGVSFIKFYYQVLFFMTNDIGRMYIENSTVCINDKVYRGPEEIQGAFLKLGFQDLQIDIKSASFMPVHDDSILILVSGRITSDTDGPERLISHSFVISESKNAESKQASFVLVSDVIHCLEGPPFGESSAPAAEAETETEPAAAPDDAETETAVPTPAAEPEVPADADEPAEAAASEPAMNGAAAPAETSAEPEAPETSASEIAPEPVKAAPKEASSAGFSYAQMLAKPKAAAPAAAPVASTGGAGAPAAAPAAGAPTGAPATGTPSAATAAPGAKGKAPKGSSQMNGNGASAGAQGKSRREGGGPPRKPSAAELTRSLYIKDMPRDFSESKIRECFSQFGEVVSVELPPGKHFAFVNFDSPESMKKALAEEAITMGDSKLYVEARSASGGGRGGSGGNGGRGRGGRGPGGGGGGHSRGPRAGAGGSGSGRGPRNGGGPRPQHHAK